MRAAIAGVVLALTVVPFAGTSNAGCVENLLRSSSPGIGGTVTIHPDGSVTVDPNPAVGFAGATAGTANAFVDCVV